MKVYSMKKTKNFKNIPNFGAVTGIPIDPMHAISEGVVKRLLMLWERGPKSVRFFTKKNSNVLTTYLKLIAMHIPKECGRKITSIDTSSKWKATQYRLFLVYVGIVALRAIFKVDNEILINFTKLNVATRLLSLNKNTDVAEQYMKEFVIEFIELYGPKNATTCIHALLHLTDDVKNLGPLDTFSAYPFENFLRHIKRSLHSTKTPLEQLSNTYAAMLNLGVSFCTKPTSGLRGPSNLHYCGPLVLGNFKCQYNAFHFENFTLTNATPDNCCQINDEIILVENFAEKNDGSIYIIGRMFVNSLNLFTEPCPSMDIGIFLVKNLSALLVWPIHTAVNKCMCLPLHDCTDQFAIIPLLHTFTNWKDESD